jgi:hypothetical protein
MKSLYQKFKNAESILQSKVEPLGYTVLIEPIAALDMFYSDGLAANYYGKASFTKKDGSFSEYQIFFPYYTFSTIVPDNISSEYKAWIEEVLKS